MEVHYFCYRAVRSKMHIIFAPAPVACVWKGIIFVIRSVRRGHHSSRRAMAEAVDGAVATATGTAEKV